VDLVVKHLSLMNQSDGNMDLIACLLACLPLELAEEGAKESQKQDRGDYGREASGGKRQ
jgi:hypothetical protein